jgi:phosphopantothenoylcysteine decarboxylase
MANLLLGVTGSVAAVKVPELFARLAHAGHQVKIVATHAAFYFFDPAEVAGPCYRDEDEWPGRATGQRYHRDDPVLHIELRRWADLLLIAPLDANTLAKLANGLADNCLTCVWRAWDPARPVVLAPAMNTLMWDHPLTTRHLRQLASNASAGDVPADLDLEMLMDWINQHRAKLHVVPPVSKRLACGDVGVGALASVDEIVAAVQLVCRKS